MIRRAGPRSGGTDIRVYGSGQETDLAVIGRIDDVTDGISGGADLALKADKSLTVSAAGLLSGGGTLGSPVTLTAPRATSEQIASGEAAGIMTPADVNTMLGPVVVSTEKDFATAMVESVTQLVSADGARMLQWDLSGNMLGVSIVTTYDFASSLDDAPAVLISSDKALLQEYGGAQAEPAAANTDAYLKPYVSGTQLRAIGQADYLLHEMGSKSVLATYAVSDDYVTAIINMPSIGPATAYKVVPDLPWLFPAERRVLHIVVLIGQSLAIGSHSDVNPTLTGQTRDGALMLTLSGYTDVRLGRSPTAVTAISGSEIIGFEPLTPKPSATSTQYVQTLLESMAFTLADEVETAIPAHLVRTLYICSGQGDTAYAAMAEGTPCFENVITAVTRAKELAAAQDWSVVVDAIILKHGEADASSLTYKADLVTWQAAYDRRLRAVTDQAAAIPFIMQMPSSYGNTDSNKRAVTAMRELHRENPLFHLSGADYPRLARYHTDYIHFTGPGYHEVGEDIARAYQQVCWTASAKSHVLDMMTASRSGLDITVEIDVPVAPMAFDTTLVPERDVKGFVVQDSAGTYTISSATIADDGSATGIGKVVLTLASAPTGAGLAVRYAWSGHSGGRTAATVPRGNVRDSAPEVSSYDGSPSPNWLIPAVINVT
ncbi:hypothetical protein KHC28_24040 [Ancylobacter sonchi]|uniref:hypothetical protein n=1 Tax=Ancylobacter sonchi TaxID=1937790 RepID=UPI001BD30D49|nr:hypothetical protein [Ancylobacter sonchi]MBS7536728.1 hypothetical protein [Ancylobacter sonchi]